MSQKVSAHTEAAASAPKGRCVTRVRVVYGEHFYFFKCGHKCHNDCFKTSVIINLIRQITLGNPKNKGVGV